MVVGNSIKKEIIIITDNIKLQAKEEGLNILKGSGSFPVFFWKLYIRHKETRRRKAKLLFL